MATQLAFMDFGKRIIVVEAGNPIRTGHHAITAADTAILVVTDNSRDLVFLQRGDGTDRNSDWVDAVHTRVFDESEAVHLLVFRLAGTFRIHLDDIQRIR